MSPKRLRLLTECLELGFMTDEDRKGWASDLRGFAKWIEWRFEDNFPSAAIQPHTGGESGNE